MRIVERMRIPSIPKKVASTPQRAGPMRNADPKAAPISPIFFARVSEVEISEIQACTTQNPPPAIPDIKRAKRQSPNPKVAI